MSNMNDLQKRADAIGNIAAYPLPENYRGGGGLSKLELFAAMAMQGLSGKVFEADIRHCDIISESLSLARSLCLALAEAEAEKEVGNG